MKPWHEQDRFWQRFGPRMFTEERWEATPAQVDHIVELAGIEAGMIVCDLACGPGRHSLELARRGVRVVAVDRTEAYLAEARERASREDLDLELVHADMREFRWPGTFDALVNMFTAFGYFEDPDEDRRTAENMVASLKPGGRLLVEMMGKEVLASKFQPRDWQPFPDGGMLIEERTLDQDWSWIRSRWTLLLGSERTEYLLEHRLYSAAELKALFLDAGLTSARAYGALDGRPYDHEAKRLVLVGEK
jgi:cyclopropane fatty-acyl-phospholipid synthase-like methyltransferase